MERTKRLDKRSENDFLALVKLETGIPPAPMQVIIQAKNATKKGWRATTKTAEASALLMQDTEDDIEHLEKIQQAAFLSIGLKVAALSTRTEWTCAQCEKSFSNKQAMRMHETVMHKLKHIAHAYLPGTNCQYCLREYHTKDKAFQTLP